MYIQQYFLEKKFQIYLDCSLTGCFMIISEVIIVLINEIAKRCNITKKAVRYYVEQKFIVPTILENGYMNFSEQDVKILKEIVLYRKLGLSISEIKKVYDNQKELKGILYQRTLDAEKEKLKQNLLKRIEAGEFIENLEYEINHISSNTIIISKLMELFPSYYGKFISLNFARYFTGQIETEEQRQAFQEIIVFFDNAPDIEIPTDLREYLDNYLEEYSSEEGIEKINGILQEKENAIKNIDIFVEKNKDILEEYYQFKQTETYKNSPAYRLMEYMKEFCSISGYYDIFIPAMRKLSPSYNAYYEQMLNANEQFVQLYPKYLG